MSIFYRDNKICFESPSLENLLEDWHEHLQKKENITPDGLKETKQSLHSALLLKFGNYFPIATTFIPASRAALAVSSNYHDYHLKEFKGLIEALPQFESRKLEIINTIGSYHTIFIETINWLDIASEKPFLHVLRYGEPQIGLITKQAGIELNKKIRGIYKEYSDAEDICIMGYVAKRATPFIVNCTKKFSFTASLD
jgi:hypothetical protein